MTSGEGGSKRLDLATQECFFLAKRILAESFSLFHYFKADTGARGELEQNICGTEKTLLLA
jgi:hypothetical protein